MPSPGADLFPSQADLFYFCTTSSTSEEDLSIHYALPSRSSLRGGVLVLGNDQVHLLDLTALDMLAMLGRNRIMEFSTTQDAANQSIDEIDIRYVSETGDGSFPITTGSRMPVTNSFHDAPQFDILIIPGSSSATPLSPSAISFLVAQCQHPNLLAVMSIASGICRLAQTGLLHKMRAAAPSHLLLPLRHQYPETDWQHASWCCYDKIWSSNSAISALKMIAAWMREYFWDRSEAVECALNAAGIRSLHDYSHCDY